LLLAKSRRVGEVEVYNDLNADVVNAFRQAKHHGEELLKELSYFVNSRREMKRLIEAPPLTEIQKAAAFLHTRMISFGGDGGSFGVVKKSGGGAASSLDHLKEKVKAFADRFDKVAVENLEWQRCLALYDGPRTCFFVDPPYIGGKQKAYKSWTMLEFTELETTLSNLKGRWILTCNDAPELRKLFKGYRIKPVDRAMGICKRSEQKRYAELIITSW
jgi:DNA adenine methylase